jgi:hypothetical protein
VILLDADDILLETAVERHLKQFGNPAVVKSCGYMEIIDNDGNRSGDLLPASLGSSGNYLGINLKYGPNTYHSSFTSGNAWSRSFLEQVMPLPENDLIGPDGYLTAVEWLFGNVAFIHDVIALYRFHGNNKGPMNFRFDTEYMKNRLDRWDYRNWYAETWAKELGHTIDRKHFWQQRNWRLILMSYTLFLLDRTRNRPSLWALAASPLHRHGGKTLRSLSVSIILILIWLLPTRQAIRLAEHLLTSRHYGCVRASLKEHA